jgi:hypothetical protein
MILAETKNHAAKRVRGARNRPPPAAPAFALRASWCPRPSTPGSTPGKLAVSRLHDIHASRFARLWVIATTAVHELCAQLDAAAGDEPGCVRELRAARLFAATRTTPPSAWRGATHRLGSILARTDLQTRSWGLAFSVITCFS